MVGVCICKKDKKIADEKNTNNGKVDGEKNIQFHKLEKIPTRRNKKKNKTTMPKLETENVIAVEETEDKINGNINNTNENEKKRKKGRSKTKKHTVKSRKNKKHKSTKINKNTDE